MFLCITLTFIGTHGLQVVQTENKTIIAAWLWHVGALTFAITTQTQSCMGIVLIMFVMNISVHITIARMFVHLCIHEGLPIMHVTFHARVHTSLYTYRFTMAGDDYCTTVCTGDICAAHVDSTYHIMSEAEKM